MSEQTSQQKYRAKLKRDKVRLMQIKVTDDIHDVMTRFCKISNQSITELVGNILLTWSIDTLEAMPELEAWEKRRNELLTKNQKRDKNE